jgi:glycosyltransferase involved in cell wall biosynthesis
VPEVVEDGVSGCIAANIDQAVAALDRVRSMSRLACRRAFELRFTVERMAREYLDAYAALQARI